MNVALLDAPAFSLPPRNPHLAHWLRDFPPQVFDDRLHQSMELLERYSVELAVDLSRQLNITDNLGQWRSADDLARALSFQPRFRFALAWILERLFEIGCLERRIDGDARLYRSRSEPWHPMLAELRTMGLKIDPANAATLDLLDYAAALYPSVARGEQSGDHGLFGSQGIALWLNYFNNENLTYAVNNWISALIAADRVAARHKLRILEVGAGAGSATQALLRCLDERGLLSRIDRYVITEPNAFFRRRGQRELALRYPDLAVEYGALDLNLPWGNQTILPGTFDLVYAVNVLHVSKNVLFSLNQVRCILAPDGWLVIGECLRPYEHQPMYPELMFQILESFTDVQLDPEIRPNPGFLTADHWRRAFRQAGFENISVAPDVDKIREIYRYFFAGAVCGQNISPQT